MRVSKIKADPHLHSLKIEKKKIYLDGFRLKGVMSYELSAINGINPEDYISIKIRVASDLIVDNSSNDPCSDLSNDSKGS